MNWTRLLLKCLATKKPSSIQLLSYPFSWFLYTIFPTQKFTSRLFSRHNCFNPPSQNCTFNIPYFVVLLFSYTRKKISCPIISQLLFMWNQNLLIYSHGSYFFAMICSNSRSEKKDEEIFLINSECPKVPYTKIIWTRKSPQFKFYQKKNSRKIFRHGNSQRVQLLKIKK